MKAKEEYEKALKEINDAFYGANFLNNQTRRFDDNLNLLRELVNENFEEKQETNLEHYFEYLSKLKMSDFALIDGRFTKCSDTSCSECDFNGDCIEGKFRWLKQPYKKPTYKLTQCEYDMLDTIFEKEDMFSKVYLIGELKKKGYFENIKCDNNVRVKNILANCEVVG